jgi:hypothetical protein
MLAVPSVFCQGQNQGVATGYSIVQRGTTTSLEEWCLCLNSSGNSITFVNALDNSPSTRLTATCSLTNTNWTQIVLTYASNGSSLYLNGSLAMNGSGVTNWPVLTNRQLGMVIGNNMAHNAPINGQFEEMETFNYQLTASEISSNFQTVASVDSDLDGIPDLLEDIHLLANRPFLGAPVVITGTIEAEQFDIGGPGVGYSNIANLANKTYRPTGLLITNCDDLGMGYCLDQMAAGDWAQYSIYVLVPQTYMVSVRTEAIGTNTGGIFQCEFSTNGHFYTNTGSLTNMTNNWTSVSQVVYLQGGANIMRLQCLTNANGVNVGRFNYISVYPYWTPPTNGPTTVTVSTNSTSLPYLVPGSNYSTAYSNSLAIMHYVNNLPSNGGSVTIPAGTWYVSQYSPNDAADAYANAAINVTNNNIAIKGEGTNNTFLIANNRATTLLCVGANAIGIGYQCTNFVLSDITLEAQPHEVATNAGSGLVYTNIYELGQLYLGTNSHVQGSIAVVYGNPPNQLSYNLCFSNCAFLQGIKSIVPVYPNVSNLMVQSCLFVPWDIGCTFNGMTNTGAYGTTNEETLRTTNWQGEDCGIFGGVINAVIVDNNYIGSTALTTLSTNTYCAPDGFIFLQQGGNIFVSGNTISNYELEGIQFLGGPNSVAGNKYDSLVDLGGALALCISSEEVAVTNASQSYSTCFVGNSIYGGQQGARGTRNSHGPIGLNFSGNSLYLYPAYNATNDYLGAAVGVLGCQSANICGNTVTNGSYGCLFNSGCSNALILNNDFGSVTYQGIGFAAQNSDFLDTAQIYGNILGKGVSFHAQLTWSNSFGWFLGQNTYVSASSNSVPLFLDPASSAVHILQ